MYFTVDNVIFARYDITDRGDFGYGLGNPGDQGRLTGMQGFQDPLALHFTNWLWQPQRCAVPRICQNRRAFLVFHPFSPFCCPYFASR